MITDSAATTGNVNGSASDANAVGTETYQSMLQRKLNPQSGQSHSNGHSTSDDGNGEYGRNAVAQGLSFSSFVQQSRSLDKSKYDPLCRWTYHPFTRFH